MIHEWLTQLVQLILVLLLAPLLTGVTSKIRARAISSAFGDTPSPSNPNPITSNHSTIRLSAKVNSPAANFPNNSASR